MSDAIEQGGAPAAPAAEGTAVNRWIIALAVMSATFMEVLDTTVVNVSLPHIAGNLSVTIAEATWVLTSYLVANAIILPMTGWMASAFGRKRLLLISVIGFTSASVLCGAAPNLTTLIVFRLVQGMAGGVLQPLSQAVLFETFPLKERGKAMAFWGIGIMVAPIFGPVLGGWITDSYSWRWLFYINVPVGVLAIIMTQTFLVDPPYLRNTSRRVDYWGISLLVIGIGALQLVLDKGQEDDWFASRMITTLAITSLIALVIFVIHQLTTEDPVVDLRVMKDRTYATGLFLMTTLGFVLFGSTMVLPVFLQTVLGYPSLQAGLALSPRGVGALLTMPMVGLLTSRIDPRKMIVCGLLAAAFPMLWLGTLNLDAGYWDIFWPQIIQGAGISLVFVPLSTVTMASISRQQMGNATSLFSLVRNLGAGMGIAVMGTMLVHYQEVNTAGLSTHVTAYDAASQSTLAQLKAGFMAAGADAVTATQQAYGAVAGLVAQQASMVAFATVFKFCGVLFLLLLPLVYVMRRPKMTGEAAMAIH